MSGNLVEEALAKNAEPDQPCPFQCLPDENLLHIFSFLDVIDISNSSVVCKRWQRLSCDTHLQRTVIINLEKWRTYKNCHWVEPEFVTIASDTLMAEEYSPSDSDGYFFAECLADDSIPMVRDKGHKELLKQFVTQRTMNLIIRWPFDKQPCRPNVLTNISQRDGKESFDGYQDSVEWDFRDILKNHLTINGMESKSMEQNQSISSNDGNKAVPVTAGLSLILQNLNFLVNSLRYNIPQYVKEIRLEDVMLGCVFPSGRLNQTKPPTMIFVYLGNEVIVRENNIWPFDVQDHVMVQSNEDPVTNMIIGVPDIPVSILGFFTRFLPLALTSEEAAMIEERIQSHFEISPPVSWYLHKFDGVPQERPNSPVNMSDLTLERVRNLPFWLQHFLVTWLKGLSTALYHRE